MKKKIIVGLDFDGVVAYNPIRILRLPVALAKQYFLGKTTTHFFVPKTPFTKFIWAGIFESSVFPARGSSMLAQLVREKKIEVHLVTARFSFMRDHLYRWLRVWRMGELFTSITTNDRDEQPHVFKARIVAEKKFDIYIEDNWDIVSHLNSKKLSTRVYWIYNILDRGRKYPYKYPYILKALEDIMADAV